ncbi:alpha/beta fold hydrolase [Isoptericola jiangsuensis]|uniref:alpha/beta fold hydrolase n=1 Tax=Isoptericola jiangsuensis TaxID=548579 RepID=UPI003AAB116F
MVTPRVRRTDIVLVPGFWLNASAWDAVTPPLVAAGHTVHPLTLPGTASVDEDRTGITLADHEAAVVGLTDDLRRQFRERAVPQPGGTVREPHRLSDDLSRLDVPTTVVASEMSADVLRGLMTQGHPYVTELARHHRYEIVDLPTGHWPMFTRPVDLGEAIAAAIAR